MVRVPGSATLKLVDVNPAWFGLFIVFLIIAVIIFLLFALFSNLIRDPGPEDARVKRWSRRFRRPFSLARTQMAVWFFVIIACYVFIWMVTGNGDSITGTVLGLMGISATTALGAVLIDNSKKDDRASLEAERQSVMTRISELETKAQAVPPTATADEMAELNLKRTRKQEIDQKLVTMPAAPTASAPRTTDGFLTDILSDADGVSFHRFQIAAWTVALSFIFLATVFNSLTMPDFNGTLLALMGISSGTYLGFKFPEKQA